MPSVGLNQQRSFAYCDTYNCTKRATFFVGKDATVKRANYNLCPECARELARSIIANPDFKDLLPQTEVDTAIKSKAARVQKGA